MKTGSIEHIKDNIVSELYSEFTDIVDFWMKNAVDNVYGGFIGMIDGNNIAHYEANKGVILNTRILWTFSAAYRFGEIEEYRKIADYAYNYIVDFFVDKERGGVYWELDYKGRVVNNRKQIYAQAFAIYALTEYFKISGNNDAINLAGNIFNLVETKAFDKNFNGYIEAFNVNWEDTGDYRLSSKDLNTPKSMNTHIHLLEAYTNYYLVTKDSSVGNTLDNVINLLIDKFIDDKTGHLHLFFDREWNIVGNKVSYGHDIETSWLLCEASEVLNDGDIPGKVREASIRLLDAAMEGMDEDGGLMNEKSIDSGHLDSDKHWWPQAEALVGFANAYRITGDTFWIFKLDKTFKFIKKFIKDRENGEWHFRVNRYGKLYRDEKVGFWKCPYHNTRACIEVIKRISEK